MEIIHKKFKLSNYKIPKILVRFRKFSLDKNKWNGCLLDTQKPFKYVETGCSCEYPTNYCNGNFIVRNFLFLNLLITISPDRFGHLCKRQYLAKKQKINALLDRKDIFMLIRGVRPKSQTRDILIDKFQLGKLSHPKSEVFPIFIYSIDVLDDNYIYENNVTKLMSNTQLIKLYKAIATDNKQLLLDLFDELEK